MDGTDELIGLFPPGTRQDGDGMLMVGGCRLDDVTREYGTPVMVVAEDALRRRASDYRERLAAAGRTPEWCSPRKPSAA